MSGSRLTSSRPNIPRVDAYGVPPLLSPPIAPGDGFKSACFVLARSCQRLPDGPCLPPLGNSDEHSTQASMHTIVCIALELIIICCAGLGVLRGAPRRAPAAALMDEVAAPRAVALWRELQDVAAPADVVSDVVVQEP